MMWEIFQALPKNREKTRQIHDFVKVTANKQGNLAILLIKNQLKRLNAFCFDHIAKSLTRLRNSTSALKRN